MIVLVAALLLMAGFAWVCWQGWKSLRWWVMGE